MTTRIEHAPYGMQYTSRGSLNELMTKNNFTTEAPLVFAMYMDGRLERGPMLIEAVEEGDGLTTRQREVPLSRVLGLDPADAFFSFEESYEGYGRFAIGSANRSDVVVVDRSTGRHVSAFEVKLCVVPNSGTAGRSHDEQSCEIVVRPPSIEQLAFSIADTYGEEGRQELGDLIVDQLGGNAQGYQWSNKEYMIGRLPQIRSAVTAIAQAKLDRQKPFAIMGLWRTRGQSEMLETNCFDTFVWTNLAFLELLAAKQSRGQEISRPDRSLIWLVKSLYDYSIQRRVDFGQAHSQITFNAQTDKAGAFAGNVTRRFLAGSRFFHPIIRRENIPDMLPRECIERMKPERRLDAALRNGAAELLDGLI